MTAIDPGVMILPTKTRPKKLHLRGSDGRRSGFRPDQSIEGLSETGLSECRRRTDTVADWMFWSHGRFIMILVVCCVLRFL